jgi:hypothetical protein
VGGCTLPSLPLPHTHTLTLALTLTHKHAITAATNTTTTTTTTTATTPQDIVCSTTRTAGDACLCVGVPATDPEEAKRRERQRQHVERMAERARARLREKEKEREEGKEKEAEEKKRRAEAEEKRQQQEQARAARERQERAKERRRREEEYRQALARAVDQEADDGGRAIEDVNEQFADVSAALKEKKARKKRHLAMKTVMMGYGAAGGAGDVSDGGGEPAPHSLAGDSGRGDGTAAAASGPAAANASSVVAGEDAWAAKDGKGTMLLNLSRSRGSGMLEDKPTAAAAAAAAPAGGGAAPPRSNPAAKFLQRQAEAEAEKEERMAKLRKAESAKWSKMFSVVTEDSGVASGAAAADAPAGVMPVIAATAAPTSVRPVSAGRLGRSTVTISPRNAALLNAPGGGGDAVAMAMHAKALSLGAVDAGRHTLVRAPSPIRSVGGGVAGENLLHFATPVEPDSHSRNGVSPRPPLHNRVVRPAKVEMA